MSRTLPSTPYHHGDLPKALTEAACRHISDFGVEKLSLRALARDVGVSATAPYRHFPTKRCLLAALAVAGFRELREALQDAIAEDKLDPAQDLVACGLAYVNYARSHPVKYHMMFGGVVGDFSDYSDLKVEANASFQVVISVLQRGVDEGVFEAGDMADISATVWASVHGIASLLINRESMVPGADVDSGSATPAMAALEWLEQDCESAMQRLARGLQPDC